MGGVGWQKEHLDIIAEALPYELSACVAIVAVQDQQAPLGGILRLGPGDEDPLQPFQRNHPIYPAFFGFSE